MYSYKPDSGARPGGRIPRASHPALRPHRVHLRRGARLSPGADQTPGVDRDALRGRPGSSSATTQMWHFDGPTLFPFAGDWRQALDSRGERATWRAWHASLRTRRNWSKGVPARMYCSSERSPPPHYCRISLPWPSAAIHKIAPLIPRSLRDSARKLVTDPGSCLAVSRLVERRSTLIIHWITPTIPRSLPHPRGEEGTPPPGLLWFELGRWGLSSLNIS